MPASKKVYGFQSKTKAQNLSAFADTLHRNHIGYPEATGTSVAGGSLVVAKCDTGQALLPGDTTGKTFSRYSLAFGAETFTADDTTDILTDTSHGLSNGDIVTLTTTDTLPAPLALATNYYVISATADTFQLSTSLGGAAVDITDTGTGTHTWNAAGLTDTGSNITVKDALNCNCYLPGETGHFQLEGSDYVPVGSHGLVRFANADATIAVDSSGASKFYENKVLTTAFTIHNTYEGYKRALVGGFSDDCVVIYDRSQSKWIALPPWAAQFATGNTTAVLPHSGTVPAIDGFTLNDYKAPDAGNESAPGSGAWSNTHGLAGPDNTTITFYRSVDNSKGNWRAIQCDLVTMASAKDLREDTSSPYKVQNMYQTHYGYVAIVNSSTWTDEITTEACP